MLKVKELSNMIGLKRHTLLYHVRTKERIGGFFKRDLTDNSYYIDDNDIEMLLLQLLELNLINRDVFNSTLKSVKNSLKYDMSETDKNVDIKVMELENKHLKELLNAVKDENELVKDELKEKNKQIDKLIEENQVNQQLMIQYQIERSKLIESKEEKKLRWWHKLFSK